MNCSTFSLKHALLSQNTLIIAYISLELLNNTSSSQRSGRPVGAAQTLVTKQNEVVNPGTVFVRNESGPLICLLHKARDKPRLTSQLRMKFPLTNILFITGLWQYNIRYV